MELQLTKHEQKILRYYPEQMPLLTAKDIVKHQMDGPNDTHCLLGWRANVLGWGVTRIPIGTALKTAISEYKDHPRSQDYCIVNFNDDPRNTKALLARVWNRAMYLLGYTVGNKENKPLTPRKKNARTNKKAR